MLTKRIALAEVKNFLKDLNENGIHVTDAWLFGSIMQRRHKEYSDIDLAVWADEFTGVSFIDAEKFKGVQLKYIDIEPHTYPTGENELDNPLIDVIKKTGQRIDLAQ